MMSQESYATSFHAPVLCHTAVNTLVTDRSGVYVDATLGGGGHSRALLDHLASEGSVIGIDRDEEAICEAKARLADERMRGRFRALHAAFDELERFLSATGLAKVDGILADLGVSSYQLDRGKRGFSHRLTGPLDMRMDRRKADVAAGILNSWDTGRITKLLRSAGEEPAAGRIARAIVAARPLDSTKDLASAVRKMVPTRLEAKTLARVFQAVRIAVNQELNQLDSLFGAAERLVRTGGHMTIISYHSLEDRRVKRMFRYGNTDGVAVRDIYGNVLAPWKELMRRPVRPSPAEAAANPRARSAKLRAAVRQDNHIPTTI